MPGFTPLRTVVGGSDEEQSDFKPLHEVELGPAKPRNALTAGLSSGVDQLQGTLWSTGAALADATGATGARDYMNEQARKNEIDARLNGRPDLERIEDQSLSSALPYLGYQVMKQVPNAAGAIAAGAVVPEVAVPTALARGASFLPKALGGGGITRGALEAAEGYAAKKALVSGATAAGETLGKQLVGGLAFNEGQAIGALYQEAKDNPDVKNPGLASIALSPAYALMETAPEAALVGRFTHGSGFSGNLLSRTAKSVGVQAASGATSELGQTAMELGIGKARPGDEIASQFLNAGVTGGLVEGVFGLAGGRSKTPSARDTGGEVGKALETTSAGTTPVSTAPVPPAGQLPVAPPPSASTTPTAPIVQGGATDIAQAQTAAANQQAAADAAAQQQATREEFTQRFGGVSQAVDETGQPTEGFTFQNKYYPTQQELDAAVDKLVAKDGQKPDFVKQAEAAWVKTFTTPDGVPSISSVNTKLRKYAAGTTSVEQIATRVNAAIATLSRSGKGLTNTELTKLAEFYENLTGQKSPAYAAAESNVKGAKNGLQLQTTSGLGTVPGQGQTTSGSAGPMVAGGLGAVGASPDNTPADGQQGIAAGAGSARSDAAPAGGTDAAQAPQVSQTPVSSLLTAQADPLAGRSSLIGATNEQTQTTVGEAAPGQTAAAAQADSGQTGGSGVPAVDQRGSAGPRVYDPTIAYYATDLSHIPVERRREIRDNILRQALAPTQERSNTLSLKQRMEMVLGALIHQYTQEQIAADIKSKAETVSKALNRLGIVMVPRLSAAQQAEKASLEARLGISPETAAELAKLKKADREKQRSAAVTADLPVDEISKALARLNELESSAAKSYSAVEFAGTLLDIAANYRSPEFPDGIGPGEFAFLYHAERKVSTKDTADDERARELENVTNEQLSDAGFGTVKTGGGSQGSVESQDKAFFDRVEVLTRAMSNAKTEEERAAAQKELEAEWAKYGKKQKKRSNQSVAEEFGYEEEDTAASENAAPEMTEEERAAEAWAELAPKGAPAFDEMPDDARALFIAAGEEAWSKKTVEAVLDKYADEVSYAKTEPKKESKRAPKKQSAGKVDVGQQAGDGKAVGEGNPKPQQPAGASEAKGEVAIRTPKEQYEALTKDIPGMPTFEQLPRNLQQQVTDQANAGGLTLASLATMGQAAKFSVADQSNVIDVEARVVDETVGKQVAALPAPQVNRLEKHYGLKADTPEFLAKVKEDVVKYATKGAEAVAAAIRDVIKAIHSGVLAMAMVFNPMHISTPEAFVVVPKAETVTQTREVKATVPSDVKGMSDAGKQAYATLIPAMKGKNGDKLIIIADKPSGQIFVFDANGKLVVQKKTLYGAAKGDLYKGNNDLPQNRITPAGLFGLKLVDAAKGGSAAKTAGEYDFGKVFAFEDPDAVVTIMHSVWLHEKDAPQRAAALQNNNPSDSRYSFGCINVDKATYKMLLDNYQAQMDGSKLFVVPDEASKVGDFLAGNVPYDKMNRQSVTPATETVTTTRGSATQTASVDRTQVGKEEGVVEQSRSEDEGDTYSEPDYLEDSLLSFVNRSSLGNSVFVTANLESLRDTGEFAEMSDREYNAFLAKHGIDAKTQAFVSKATGKAYLVAENIVIGKERGVFMHEVGVHLGMQSKLPQALFDRLVGKIQSWAAANDGSLESVLAAKALARAVSTNVNTAQRRRELVAYFVEEAVNAGINPTAYEKIQSAGLREWMRSLWAAFKNAIRMLRGLNIDKMTGQDVVDLAYGFAQLETAGRFHGANVKFRQFSTKFMGTGVGGQAYGWGLYFAQARPTAETYAVIEDDKEASFVGTPESRLYHVDLAIDDDEWLEWGKPLGKQSARVRAALKKLGLYPSDDQVFDRPFLRNVIEKKAGSEKAASEMLDAAGIKGTKYRDATSADPSSNLVVFNARNVIRVGDQKGVQTNPDDRMAPPEFDWDEVQQSRADVMGRMPAQLRKPAESAWTTLFRNAALPLMITEDVVAMAAKFMRSAPRYLQAQYDRQKTRLQIEGVVEKILDRFDRLDVATQKLVNEYIYDSTLNQKWGYYPGEHRVGTTLFEVDPDYEERFNNLPAAAQALVEDVFEHGYQMMKLKERAVDLAIEREFKDREDAALGDPDALKAVAKEKSLAKKREMANRGLDVDKPYAYLGRHGDFVVVAKSKEFKHFEERAKLNDWDAQQAKNWLQDNVSNPDHYVVQFAETQGEADKIAGELMATGKYDLQPDDAGPKELNASYSGGDAFLAVKRLRTMLDRQGTPQTVEEMKSRATMEKALSDLYLATVSEASARKSELQRKYVAGADKNMMRNLATSGRADAHFVSTLLHNDEIVDSLEEMRTEAARNRRDAMPYYNELYARYGKGMEYKEPAPLVRAANQLSNVYYLATNPAFYLQQIMQTGVLSLPYLAGRLGYFRSARAISAAYKDMQQLVKGLTLTSHVDFSKAPADVRGMLETLVGMGKIDIGIDADAKARSGEHGLTDKVMRKLQGVNTRIETINRATAAIAAYRGYLQRYGANKTAEATKFAAEVVSNTHGSYDGFNTPRAMNNDFGRFFLQFKRFQIIQLSMLAKLMHNAFKGASPEEKAVARKTLGFITAHMAVLGGALGVPFVSQLGGILLSVLGDDDEPDDLEAYLRKLIDDKAVADLLLRGVPSAVGLESLGKKLAMENVASVLPFTDVDLTSRSGMEKVLVGLMGPTVALGRKAADAMGAMAKGDYWKGLELLMPTGIANVSKGLRFATEGVTMRNGDTVMGPEEISILDAALQAVGLPTDAITDRQRIQSLVAKTDKFYESRAAELKGDYVRAFKDGDSNGMQDARQAWQELQDARRRNGYTPQPLSTLFRAPMEANKRQRNVAGGVEFNKNNRQFVEKRSNQ